MMWENIIYKCPRAGLRIMVLRSTVDCVSPGWLAGFTKQRREEKDKKKNGNWKLKYGEFKDNSYCIVSMRVLQLRVSQ